MLLVLLNQLKIFVINTICILIICVTLLLLLHHPLVLLPLLSLLHIDFVVNFIFICDEVVIATVSFVIVLVFTVAVDLHLTMMVFNFGVVFDLNLFRLVL